MRPLFFVCLILFPAVLMADVGAGISAFNNGDYAAALDEFKKASDTGEAAGTHYLASMYYQGKGVKRDLDRAVQLFLQAATKDFVPSLANLGLMYHRGDGVKQDLEKALSFYRKAAQKGDLQSAFNLGQMYRKGEGVAADNTEALRYYRLAAERGYVPAANELGLMYVQGQGVKADYIEAYGWLEFASNSGDESAGKNLEQLKEILGEKGLDRAEARAEEISKRIKK